VLEMMQQLDWRLGGESSGHIICLDKTTTGDAIISALQVLESLQEMQITLSQAAKLMTKYPQTLINVPIREKTDLQQSTRVQDTVQAIEKELEEQGRVLLRMSGTEPLIRVMVEGADSLQVQAAAKRLADIVQQECA
jgi:phosphoglucosamine mutase